MVAGEPEQVGDARAEVLRVSGLTKAFVIRRSLADRVRRRPGAVQVAVNAVSLGVLQGEILGLVGGSGSGKSTLARCITRLIEPDAGEITCLGQDVRAAKGHDLRELRRRMQMVFQDPYASLNPRMTIGAAVLEAGRAHHRPGSENRRQFVGELLERVQLPRTMTDRYPRQLSGGQRQRVAIARALAVGPDVLIADEAVSALDVSVQMQILNLFLDLREQLGLSMIFVAHQLAVIAEVADRVAVMHEGRIVEVGPTPEVLTCPRDPYTVALLHAHPDATLPASTSSAADGAGGARRAVSP